MIRHNKGDVEVESCFVLVQAAFQHNRAHMLGKNPPVLGAEGDEVLMVIDLEMRKLPAVKGLRHRCEECGDSRPRLSRRSEAPLCMVGQDRRNA